MTDISSCHFVPPIPKAIFISAVIVTFEPKIHDLILLVNSLLGQVSSIYIIDNSHNSKELYKNILDLPVFFISMGGNAGIAKAQNFGATMAFTAGATDLIFFDQDSIPETNMVRTLLTTRETAEKNGIKVAATGPKQFDSRYQLTSKFIDATFFRVHLVSESEKNELYCTASFLIASGSLISEQAWKTIGNMEDELFIDCVDIEWGFRAKSKGYQCIGAFKAILHHKLGDTKINLFGLPLTNHTPIRHYYYFRNFYRLLQRRYVPLSWKIHVFIKSTIQAFIFSFLNKDGAQHAKMILTGILHGLRNKGGAYDSK